MMKKENSENQKKNKKEEKPLYTGHRQRLRERFMSDEGESMPDYELLELLLTGGIMYKDVKDLAKKLLLKYKTLDAVLDASPSDLAEMKVPFAAITFFKLNRTIHKRLYWRKLHEKDEPIFASIDILSDYYHVLFRNSKVEEFRIVFLDNCLKIIGEKKVQTGTINQVVLYPREIAQDALNFGATSVVLIHNHPGGKCFPSSQDIYQTNELEETLSRVDVKVYEHLIITNENHYSFYDNKLLLFQKNKK